jgi:hypothetical protein
MIKIKRDSGWADRFRDYKIILDGNVIGQIKNGEEKEFSIPEGDHLLSLKIDWCGSNTVSFNSNGNKLNFECGSNLRGMKILLGFIYIIFLPKRYLWLK